MAARWSNIAVTGRFQPLHVDHLDLLRRAFALGEQVIIGITNPDAAPRRAHAASAHRHLPEANPYSFAERRELIDCALAAEPGVAGRYRIVACDLDDPRGWSSLFPAGTTQLVRVFSDWEREKLRRFTAAGFPVIELAGDPQTRVSASDIRSAMRAGMPWQHWVPPAVAARLEQWRRRSA